MIIERYKNGYRASLAGYLDKYANTRHEAIALMLKQVTYWNKVKNILPTCANCNRTVTRLDLHTCS